MKHLSDLPDDLLLHILSFLPSRLVARTSLISRRFRHLWESSPVVQLGLDRDNPVYFNCSKFISLSRHCLLRRNPSFSLRHLQLSLPSESHNYGIPSIEYISSLLIKARSLALRHLTIQTSIEYIAGLLPIILSTSSLEILSLINLHTITDSMVAPLCISNSIKSMSIQFRTSSWFNATALKRLVSKLHVLEDLELLVYGNLDLCSHTVKRLKIRAVNECYQVRLSLPSLELLDLFTRLRKFHGELPLLKTALIKVSFIETNHAVCEMLKTFANVEYLKLDIFEYWTKLYQFHTLVKPGMDPPKFPNLKHFHLAASLHEYNLKDLGTLLKNSPALQSLKLNNKPLYCSTSIDMKEIYWRPELHGNTEDNYNYCYFNDLHISTEKINLLKQLDQEAIFKEVKIL